jgi:hypothetical protein
MLMSRKLLILSLVWATSAVLATPTLATPSGQFLVNISDARGFMSDSQQTITYWDTQALGSGPLFSVHVPGEFFANPAGELSDGFNKDEPEAIAVNPANGDVYILVFDSGDVGSVGTVENPGTDFADMQGDFDLYKINTSMMLDHWSSTFEASTPALSAALAAQHPMYR